MASRISSILVVGGLSIAALVVMPLVPRTVSQEAQERAAPLRDVCPEGWARYSCNEVRLCVSPEVENQYDVAKALEEKGTGCGRSDRIVPGAWAHVTPYVVGWRNRAYMGGGYYFYTRVAKLDASNVKNRDLNEAIENLHLGNTSRELSKGGSDWKPVDFESLETYKLKVPTPNPSVKEVCPAGWRRFSCEFVRLCVAPSVTNRYNLETSREFQNADCKMDSRTVGAEDTNSSPHDVGYARGWMLLGPQYVGVVKLDLSDIFDGNVDEAIQRLVLVPLPPNALIEFNHGAKEGVARFQNYLNENRIKEKEIEDAKSPH